MAPARYIQSEDPLSSIDTPAPGKQALIFDAADHHLKRKDSTGTVVDLEQPLPPTLMHTTTYDSDNDGKIDLAAGGTGANLSISGGATHVLAQDENHIISARALVAADIPSLDAAKIATGILPVARGGTGTTALTGDRLLKSASDGQSVAVLDGTGVVKMASGLPSVSALAPSDLPTGTLKTDENISSTLQAIKDSSGNVSSLRLNTYSVQIISPNPSGADSVFRVLANTNEHAFSVNHNKESLFGPSQIPIRETNFRYSNAYKVLQVGADRQNYRALSLNYDPNNGGPLTSDFNGNGEILLASNARILSPSSDQNSWRNVIRCENNSVYVGGSWNSPAALRVDPSGHTCFNTRLAYFGVATGTEWNGFRFSGLGYKHGLLKFRGASNEFQLTTGDDIDGWSGHGAINLRINGELLLDTNDNTSVRLLKSGSLVWCIWHENGNALHITDSGWDNGVFINQNSNAWASYSDARLKKNIEDIPYGLKDVLALKPIQFSWKRDDKRDIGFIAQDVSLIIPEIVDGNEDDYRVDEEGRCFGAMGIKYSQFAPVLVKAIQELDERIVVLEEKIECLKESLPQSNRRSRP